MATSEDTRKTLSVFAKALVTPHCCINPGFNWTEAISSPNQPRFLLLQRPMNVEKAPGAWELPNAEGIRVGKGLDAPPELQKAVELTTGLTNITPGKDPIIKQEISDSEVRECYLVAWEATPNGILLQQTNPYTYMGYGWFSVKEVSGLRLVRSTKSVFEEIISRRLYRRIKESAVNLVYTVRQEKE